MMRYLRLWRRFLTIAVARETEYRANFVVGVVEGLVQLALAVLTFLVLYRFAGSVAGWTRAQVLVLVGVYRVVDGLIGLLVAPNMFAIPGYVRTGDLDSLLMRPVSSRFLVSARTLSLPEAANALGGVLLTVYAGGAAGVRWSVVGVAEALVFMACGVAALYAVWFATVTLAFWLVQVDSIGVLFYGVFETARYPVSYFTGAVRAALIVAVPVAFATTFPAEALLGRADPRLLPVGILLAAVALYASGRFWDYAVRHYSSASS